MTVPSTTRRAGPFTGNGSTTTFSFSFKTFAAGDLQVVKTFATGVESVLILASDYSVSLNVDQDASPGGTITYPLSGTPLATGEKLTVLSLLAYEQTTDLLGGGAFNARVIEDTFDRTVIQIQQLEERLDRGVVLPVSASASTTLPTPQPLQVLAWNAAGDALTNRNVAQGLASGTTQVLPAAPAASTVEFTIPAWAKRVKLQLFGVSVTGSNQLQVQLGTPSTWLTTGYTSCAMYNSGTSGAYESSSVGLLLEPINAVGASRLRSGIVTLEVIDGTHWVMTSQFHPGTASFIVSAAGSIEASGITRVRLMATSTDTFDAGRVGITFE